MVVPCSCAVDFGFSSPPKRPKQGTPGGCRSVMRRYSFTAPGFGRLTEDGGPGVVDRLRGGLEPLVMDLIQTLAPQLRCRAVTTDAIHTLDGDEYPQEWWVRTSFVPADTMDTTSAQEHAWVSVEYSRWEESETWAVQGFVRVAEVEFSLSADCEGTAGVIEVRGQRLPSGDVVRIEDVLSAHFGAA